jgi:hypothetical protein
LAEFDDLIRTMPERATMRHDLEQNDRWLGRAAALVNRWDAAQGMRFQLLMTQFHGVQAREAGEAFRGVVAVINQARADLRLEAGQMSVALPAGGVFDYFDEVRKIVETATQDVLFVDPYLDAEFVSRYLAHIPAGAAIRLLTTENKLTTLLPAVDAFAQQHGRKIEVRVSQGMHDRYAMVDGSTCYQSGASFKDGAKKAPTTLTQITDAFAAVHATYEGL